MMKLTFEPWTDDMPESATRFSTLYQIFIGAANNPNRASSLEDTHSALKVLDAFDMVSETVTDNGEEGRRLKAEGGDMMLTEAAHKLIQRTVDAWLGTVPFAAARVAMKLKTFVDSAVAVPTTPELVS